MRTQRPTHLPLAAVELRYMAFKTLVEENQTLTTFERLHVVVRPDTSPKSKVGSRT